MIISRRGLIGLGAPQGTLQAMVDCLNKEINAALNDPLIKQRLAELGAVPILGTAREFGEMFAIETSRWRKVVVLSGQRKDRGL